MSTRLRPALSEFVRPCPRVGPQPVHRPSSTSRSTDGGITLPDSALDYAHSLVHWPDFYPIFAKGQSVSQPDLASGPTPARRSVPPWVKPRPQRAGSRTSTPRVRPHQADELCQAEPNANPDAVSHLPRRPHRAIIAREKFLAESALRLRAAGACGRRPLSEAQVPRHDHCPVTLFRAQTDLPGAIATPRTPRRSSSAPGVIAWSRRSVS